MQTSIRERDPRGVRCVVFWLIAASVTLGCGASQQERRHDRLSKALAASPQVAGGRAPAPTRVQARLGAIEGPDPAKAVAHADPAFATPALSRALLVREVLERNPGLEAARERARAALAGYRRETAIEDPMLEYEIAPLSIAGDAELGHRVRVTQRLPWPGTRSAAGERVLAEAEAAAADRHAVSVELASMTSMLFDRLWTSERALAVNAQHAALLASTLRGVRDALAVGGAGQAEVLMVELEEARLARDRLRLEAERSAAAGQLNALLHRAPDSPLPPAAVDEPVSAARVAADPAQDASARRPEIEAQRLRLQAARDEVTLAERERYPELLLMGEYTSMNMDPEHRLMVGVGIEVPLQQGARDAAVDGARARVRAEERELEAMRDRVHGEVHGARARADEAERAVALYAERLLPTARARLEAEALAHANRSGSLASVLQAERELRALELESIEARAMLDERRALLAAALGRFPVVLEEVP